jgi:flagellar basal-body rod protein FlgB
MLEELQTLGHALAVAAFRHRVLANDLANSATPGFRAQDVVPFGEALASALPLLQADPRHVGAPSPDGDGLGVLVVTTSLLDSPGGSGVDPDATMAAIAENALQYRALAGAASLEVAIARRAITG